jgi:hypothetical protein
LGKDIISLPFNYKYKKYYDIIMLIVRCKNCNTELSSTPQGHTCGCSNMTRVIDNTITAKDLSLVEIISGVSRKKLEPEYTYLTKEDLAWMEQRKARKVRTLDFEIK